MTSFTDQPVSLESEAPGLHYGTDLWVCFSKAIIRVERSFSGRNTAQLTTATADQAPPQRSVKLPELVVTLNSGPPLPICVLS